MQENCKIKGKEGRYWFLPHHHVYHPQRPGKIRVVFYCSFEALHCKTWKHQNTLAWQWNQPSWSREGIVEGMFWTESQSQRFFVFKGCRDYIVWKKNPPSANHFGGIWERQIHPAWAILNGLLNNHGKCLDTESLQTVMVEWEAILNSRPLTADTISDVNNSAPLAPANIITQFKGNFTARHLQ